MDLYEKNILTVKSDFFSLSSFICVYFKLFTINPSKSLTWEDCPAPPQLSSHQRLKVRHSSQDQLYFFHTFLKC